MKLMVIQGSPRKRGNSEILAEKAIEGFICCGHQEVSRVHIREKNIKYCDGCLRCLFPERTGKCVLRDEMAEILDEMRGHDAFLFVSPNHQHNVTAPMLNFISRMLPLIDFVPILNEGGDLISRKFFSDLEGKRVAFVGSQGDPYLSSSLVLPFMDKVFGDYKLVKVGDFISLGNIDKGEVLNKEGDLERAFDVGVGLGR